jgi:hypothetical protein
MANTARLERVENLLLGAALDYAGRGLPVFPVHNVLPMLAPHAGFLCTCGKGLRCGNPGKHPIARLSPHGFKDATTDAATVEHWWLCYPTANIGIATAGLVVVDVDPAKGGAEVMAELERKHSKLPLTWRVITGGGGCHVYLRDPTGKVGCTQNRPGPGVDIRGAGGYAVAPPSGHISGGCYCWEDGQGPGSAPLADAPSWLTDELKAPRALPIESLRTLASGAVTEGARNTTIARLTGHLLRKYVDPLVTLDLMQAFNAARCEPPLASEEVGTIVRSIAAKELRRRGG